MTTMEMVPCPMVTLWLAEAGPASPLSTSVWLDSVEDES